MSGVSLPVTRPSGPALVVANPSSRPQPVGILQRLGYGCVEADDPYAAMLELCRRPLLYRSLILSLASLFKEELTLIESVKRRFPQIEIWLTQTDGRQASLAEAMRLGADGLLAEDGLHRIAISSPAESAGRPPTDDESDVDDSAAAAVERDLAVGEPVLTADELRALLQEQPTNPPGTAE